MKLGVPLLNVIRIPYHTISEWKASSRGLGPFAISTVICNPEFSGLIEPTVLGGKVALKDESTGRDVYSYKPIAEQIEFLIKRIKAWRNLQTKSNQKKKGCHNLLEPQSGQAGYRCHIP